MNAPLPFKLLLQVYERPFCLRGSGDCIASFLLPSGQTLMGLPAASEPEAIHNLFEADAGAPLAKPYAEPFVPLCRDTLGLCSGFLRLMSHWDDLHARLLPNVVRGRPLHRDTVNDVHQVFASVQECFAAAQRVVSRLPADADADAREHPLFAYARRSASGALTWRVLMTLTMLGHPASIKVDGGKVVFTADLDIAPEQDGLADVSGWPTEAAHAWWKERDARMQRYTEWLRIVDSLPSSAEEGAAVLH